MHQLVLVFGAVCCLAAAAANASVKSEVLNACRGDRDTPQDEHERLAPIARLGESGRKELLRLVRKRQPQAACALDLLVGLQDTRAVPFIRSILADVDAGVSLQGSAIVGAGVFRDAASFDGVLAAFQSEQTYLILPAAMALAKFRDERGLRALREALDGNHRWTVVDAVGFEGHREAVAPLIRLMDDPAVKKYGSMRSDLTISLARIGTAESREAAMTLVESTEDATLRAHLVSELFGLLVMQRQAMTENSERAQLDDEIARLRSDRSAPWYVKTPGPTPTATP